MNNSPILFLIHLVIIIINQMQQRQQNVHNAKQKLNYKIHSTFYLHIINFVI